MLINFKVKLKWISEMRMHLIKCKTQNCFRYRYQLDGTQLKIIGE